MKSSLDRKTRRALNDYARLQAITRLEAHILFDIRVCEIEGWDHMEFINMLQELLNGIGRRQQCSSEQATKKQGS